MRAGHGRWLGDPADLPATAHARAPYTVEGHSSPLVRWARPSVIRPGRILFGVDDCISCYTHCHSIANPGFVISDRSDARLPYVTRYY